MFHFPASTPTQAMHSPAGNTTQLVLGFPIRTSSDQRFVGNSPRHNAASHVLHRLSMPRHPPYARNKTHGHTISAQNTKTQKRKKNNARVHYTVLTQHHPPQAHHHHSSSTPTTGAQSGTHTLVLPQTPNSAPTNHFCHATRSLNPPHTHRVHAHPGVCSLSTPHTMRQVRIHSGFLKIQVAVTHSVTSTTTPTTAGKHKAP